MVGVTLIDTWPNIWWAAWLYSNANYCNKFGFVIKFISYFNLGLKGKEKKKRLIIWYVNLLFDDQDMHHKKRFRHNVVTDYK